MVKTVKSSHLEYEKQERVKKWLQLNAGTLTGSLFYLCVTIATET